MRKHIRKMMKYEAEQEGAKASCWVQRRFDILQIRKYGGKRRKIHKAIGTHKRKIWKSRIELLA